MKSIQGTSVERLIQAIKSDPKRSVVLIVLVLVLVGIWLSRKAEGTGPTVAVASNVADPIKTKPRVDRTSDSPEARDHAAALVEWIRQPIVPLNRNLFAVKLDFYAQDGTKTKSTLRAPTGDGFWDDLAKSMTSQADQKKERQFLVENLRLEAVQLRLQSIMMGVPPKALINGQLVMEGSVVASFRVLKIEPRRIIVEREGIKLELLMK